MEFLPVWLLCGFLGWCVFIGGVVVKDGLAASMIRAASDRWFMVGFFAACLVFGFFSLVLSVFFTYYLPRS